MVFTNLFTQQEREPRERERERESDLPPYVKCGNKVERSMNGWLTPNLGIMVGEDPNIGTSHACANGNAHLHVLI